MRDKIDGRRHPESLRMLRSLVRLHGAEAITEAAQVIEDSLERRHICRRTTGCPLPFSHGGECHL